jgi:hypothetical protein
MGSTQWVFLALNARNMAALTMGGQRTVSTRPVSLPGKSSESGKTDPTDFDRSQLAEAVRVGPSIHRYWVLPIPSPLFCLPEGHPRPRLPQPKCEVNRKSINLCALMPEGPRQTRVLRHAPRCLRGKRAVRLRHLGSLTGVPRLRDVPSLAFSPCAHLDNTGRSCPCSLLINKGEQFCGKRWL